MTGADTDAGTHSLLHRQCGIYQCGSIGRESHELIELTSRSFYRRDRLHCASHLCPAETCFSKPQGSVPASKLRHCCRYLQVPPFYTLRLHGMHGI